MAKDDTSPGGLFSKMVKFVRSPGTQWNDLDDPSSQKEGSLSKQALKEMIERKRRNDFVRKREFDMLRKLRRREVTGEAPSDGSARPSFFQSSMPSRPDDRAMTLKKIDEIEAQMSMQWWKTKHGTAAAASSLTPSSDFTGSDRSSQNAGAGEAGKPLSPAQALAYARTAPDDLRSAIDAKAKSISETSKPQSTDMLPAIPPVIGSSVNSPISLPVQSVAPATPSSPAASESASSMEDMSLDFTTDLPLTGKPLVKPSPFSAPSLVNAQKASPLAVQTPKGATEASATSTPELKVPPAISPASAPSRQPGLMTGLAASYDATSATSGFSASKVFAIEVDDVQHDPELEEASIRFANGDDSGAESGLLEVLSARGSRHNHEETWLTLFDLYRATGQYDRFESFSIDFASKFGRSAPLWFSIPEMVAKLSGSETQAPAGQRKPDWKCPANFGIQSLAALNAALAKVPMPWNLEWAGLQIIEDAAVVPLTRLLMGWAEQPVQLRFSSTLKLEEVLRQGTPSGVRTVDQDRWNLLMAYLRVAQRPDEFELAALDFCVTYEVSPPSWERGRCEFKALDAEGNSALGQTIVGDTVHDSIVSELQTDHYGGSSMMTAQLASVELSGQIMGEPKPVLDKLEARLTGADVMIISCAKLIRVDFSAAGSLLNWVSARQAEGRIVQFTDVHRLVAAFFHVIGISEHAKVTTRVD